MYEWPAWWLWFLFRRKFGILHSLLPQHLYHTFPAALHEIQDVPLRAVLRSQPDPGFCGIFCPNILISHLPILQSIRSVRVRCLTHPHISEDPSEVPLPIRSDLLLLLPPHAHILHSAPWQPSDWIQWFRPMQSFLLSHTLILSLLNSLLMDLL